MKRGVKRSLLGAGLVLAAIVVGGSAFVSLQRGVSHDVQFKAPGTFQARAADAGRYYVWDNHKTWFEGEKVRSKAAFPDEMTVEVSDAAGQTLEFTRDDSQSWSIGSHAKTSVGYVDLPADSDVQIDARGDDGERILSLSQANLGQELWQTFIGFGIATVAAGLGIPIAIWGLITTLVSAPPVSARGDDGAAK